MKRALNLNLNLNLELNKNNKVNWIKLYKNNKIDNGNNIDDNIPIIAIWGQVFDKL